MKFDSTIWNNCSFAATLPYFSCQSKNDKRYLWTAILLLRELGETVWLRLTGTEFGSEFIGVESEEFSQIRGAGAVAINPLPSSSMNHSRWRRSPGRDARTSTFEPLSNLSPSSSVTLFNRVPECFPGFKGIRMWRGATTRPRYAIFCHSV